MGIVPGIIAVILGHVAMGLMNRTGDNRARRQAVAGLATGYVAVGIALLIFTVMIISSAGQDAA
jgi:hypothetical protein